MQEPDLAAASGPEIIDLHTFGLLVGNKSKIVVPGPCERAGGSLCPEEDGGIHRVVIIPGKKVVDRDQLAQSGDAGKREFPVGGAGCGGIPCAEMVIVKMGDDGIVDARIFKMFIYTFLDFFSSEAIVFPCIARGSD